MRFIAARTQSDAMQMGEVDFFAKGSDGLIQSGKTSATAIYSGGAVQVESCLLTHSLKGAWFQTLTLEHQSWWFQNVPK
jgi:hypothetical protein